MNRQCNKKVLLRERKRHTDRPGQGVSHPCWGLPHLRYPIRPGRCTPHQTWLGYPPIWTWLGYPPIRPGWGSPPGLDRLGYPPPIWTWLGYPPVGQTDGWKDRHVSKHNLPLVLRKLIFFGFGFKKYQFQIMRTRNKSERTS